MDNVERTRRCLATLVLLCGLLCTGCNENAGQPPKTCGLFIFQEPQDKNQPTRIQETFRFRPQDCGTSCTCERIAFIQVARIRNLDTGENIASTPEMTARMVVNDDPTYKGWAVDREEGMTHAFIHQSNDGTFNNVVLGSNSKDAIFADQPQVIQGQANLFWDFIVVAVCIDEASGCVNKILGYDYWSFATGVKSTPAREGIVQYWHPMAATLAIEAWNMQAGKTPVAALSQP